MLMQQDERSRAQRALDEIREGHRIDDSTRARQALTDIRERRSTPLSPTLPTTPKLSSTPSTYESDWEEQQYQDLLRDIGVAPYDEPAPPQVPDERWRAPGIRADAPKIDTFGKALWFLGSEGAQRVGGGLAKVISPVVSARQAIESYPKEVPGKIIESFRAVETVPDFAKASLLAPVLAASVVPAAIADVSIRPVEAGVKLVFDAIQAPQGVLFGLVAAAREGIGQLAGEDFNAPGRMEPTGEYSKLYAILDPLIRVPQNLARTIVPFGFGKVIPAPKERIWAHQAMFGRTPEDKVKILSYLNPFPHPEQSEATAGQWGRTIGSLVADIVADPALYVSFGASGVARLAGMVGERGAEVALKKVAGREWAALARELREGTFVAEEVRGFPVHIQKEIAEIAARQAAHAKELVEAGVDAAVGEGIVTPKLLHEIEGAAVEFAQKQVDHVRYARKVKDLLTGEVGWHYTHPNTKQVIDITQDQYDVANGFVKRNIDLGGVGVMVPGRVTTRTGKRIEWDRRTIVDTGPWIEQALMWGRYTKVGMFSEPRVNRVLSVVNPQYTERGKTPLALFRLNNLRIGQETFLTDHWRRAVENIIVENKLNSNQAEMVLTQLDTGKSAADPILEAVRQRVVNDPVLKQQYDTSKRTRDFVDFLKNAADVDEAGAWTVAKGLAVGESLDNPILENVRRQFRKVYDDWNNVEKAAGITFPELIGGNYVPRREQRIRMGDLIADAIEQSDRLGREAGRELLLDVTSRFKKTPDLSKYPRQPGARLTPQFDRVLYRFVRTTKDADGNISETAFVATSKQIAAKPTTVEEIGASVTNSQRSRLVLSERRLEKLDRRIRALNEITEGSTLEQIKNTIDFDEARLARIKATLLDPMTRSAKQLASLRSRQEALQDKIGVLRQVYEGQEFTTVGITGLRNRAASEFQDALNELRSLGIDDEVLGGIGTVSASNMRSAIHEVRRRLTAHRKGLVTTKFDRNRAAITIANGELRGLLEQQRNLEVLTSVDAQIGVVENRLRVLNPSKAKQMLDETKAELVTLRGQRKAALELVGPTFDRAKLALKIDGLETEIALRLEYLMERMPSNTTDLWLRRQQKERRGIFRTGDQVLIKNSDMKPVSIIGHERMQPDGVWKNIELEDVVDAVDEKSLRYVVRLADDSTDTFTVHQGRRVLKPAPDFGHLTFYSRQKAYVEEIINETDLNLDPNVLRVSAQRAVEHAKMVSTTDFYTSLKEIGWARKENPGGWVEVEHQPQLKGYYVSKQTDAFLRQELVDKGGPENVFRVINRFNNWWKGTVTSLFPAFHGQNAMGNVWLNFMDTGVQAFNPKMIALAGQLNWWHHEALRLEKKATGVGAGAEDASAALSRLLDHPVITDSNGKEWRFDELRQTMREHEVAFTGRSMGVLDPDVTTNRELNSLAAAATGEESFAQLAARRTAQELNRLGRYGRLTANVIEDQFRVQNFITHLISNGGDIVNAAERSNLFFFNYRQLTAVERKYLRPLIPFYTFQKKNLVLQTQMVFQRPTQLAVQAHLVNMVQEWTGEDPLTEEEWASLPRIHQRGLGIVTRREGGGLTYINSSGLPIQAATESGIPWVKLLFGHPLAVGTGGLGVGAVTPAIRSFFMELPTDYSFYLQKHNRGAVRIDDIGRTLEKTPAAFQTVIRRWLRIEEQEGRNGETIYLAHNIKGAYVAQNMPFWGRVFREIGRAREADKPVGFRLLEGILGMNTANLTYDDLEAMQKAFEREMKREAGIRERVEEGIGEFGVESVPVFPTPPVGEYGYTPVR